jgi:hypothetical protein
LLEISWSPRDIKVMNRNETLLYIGSGSHLSC